MSPRTLAVTGAAVLAGGLTLGAAAGHGAEGPPEGVSLTGYWTLDRDRSDDPKEKAREAMDGMRTGEYDPGSGGAPADPGVDVMTPGERDPYGGGRRQPGGWGQSPYGGGRDPRAAVFPEIDRPKELLIAQRTSLVLIQEGDDEGSVRGVHTDQQRRPIPGGGGQMSGAWEDGKLVVETWRDNGVRRTETFELSADGRELTVTIHIAAPRLLSLTIMSLYQITPSPPT